jgi:ubiquinone biosynthesis monooxygenase Coq7
VITSLLILPNPDDWKLIDISSNIANQGKDNLVFLTIYSCFCSFCTTSKCALIIERQFTVEAGMDKLINSIDKALRVVSGVAVAGRANPATGIAENELNSNERRHSAGLMRVNHVGEVCAQALYDAQRQFAANAEMKNQFRQAGREEEDHLAWTAQRLQELGSRPSILNPLWYAGAYGLGAIAARSGDARSLGFVVETERQVEAHLASHLQKLPQQDNKSRAIVEQMREDEAAHGAAAHALGATDMPVPIRAAMKAMAKIMTTAAYFL